MGFKGGSKTPASPPRASSGKAEASQLPLDLVAGWESARGGFPLRTQRRAHEVVGPLTYDTLVVKQSLSPQGTWVTILQPVLMVSSGDGMGMHRAAWPWARS